ncbi:MAG: DUF3553 domain-containing protein [Phycisphaerales bacterium]|nr:DUF3553 domain-containing protein [Phycisphaerales bacterium]
MSPFTVAQSNESAGLPSQAMISQGMQLRHRQRPEWGIGSVTRVETLTRAGVTDQRVWVRFPNAGLKTLLRSAADLEVVGGAAAADHTFAARHHAADGGWLGAISTKKPEAAMSELPPEATDPFIPLERRLQHLLGLFRFSSTGSSLMDWAVAQSGLDDPLSRFTRTDLEGHFKNFAMDRDAHVGKLLSEARKNGNQVDAILAQAHPTAKKVLVRLGAIRT